MIYLLNLFFTGKIARANVTAVGTVGEIERLKNEKLEKSNLKKQ